MFLGNRADLARFRLATSRPHDYCSRTVAFKVAKRLRERRVTQQRYEEMKMQRDTKSREVSFRAIKQDEGLFRKSKRATVLKLCFLSADSIQSESGLQKLGHLLNANGSWHGVRELVS